MPAKVQNKVVNAFACKIIDFTKQCGETTRNASGPIQKPQCAHEDCTFDMVTESTDNIFNGSRLRHCFLDKLPLVNAVVKLEIANAVIVSARIDAGAKLSHLHYVFSELVSIVVADEHRLVLAA